MYKELKNLRKPREEEFSTYRGTPYAVVLFSFSGRCETFVTRAHALTWYIVCGPLGNLSTPKTSTPQGKADRQRALPLVKRVVLTVKPASILTSVRQKLLLAWSNSLNSSFMAVQAVNWTTNVVKCQVNVGRVGKGLAQGFDCNVQWGWGGWLRMTSTWLNTMSVDYTGGPGTHKDWILKTSKPHWVVNRLRTIMRSWSWWIEICWRSIYKRVQI